MARKSIDEQIEATKKELEIKNNRLKALQSKKREKDRKARNHRLIQIGGICEKVYGDQITEGAMQMALQRFLEDQDSRGGYFSAALNRAKENQS